MNNDKQIEVLFELRPAFEGYAGIPQETRLLFRNLNSIQDFKTVGLIYHPHNTLPAKKLKDLNYWYTKLVDAVLRPQTTKSRRNRVIKSLILQVLGFRLRNYEFPKGGNKNFIWESIFSKTLPLLAREEILKAHYRIMRDSFESIHVSNFIMSRVPVLGKLIRYRPMYFKSTLAKNVFISETPFGGRIPKNVIHIVRYHDAIPITKPEFINNRSIHFHTHYAALKANIKDGAYFCCISQSVKNELLHIFPELENRVNVIPNFISPAYKNFDSASKIEDRLYLARFFERELQHRNSKFRDVNDIATRNYFLIVGTLDPRKNHLRVLEAWEKALASDPNLPRMVIVGSRGWHDEKSFDFIQKYKHLGDLIHLGSVDPGHLNTLYRNASLTICGSLDEGFDYPAVEALLAGSKVIASDIPVHREILGNSVSAYFDPRDKVNLTHLLLQHKSLKLGSKFQPPSDDEILEQWRIFISSLIS